MVTTRSGPNAAEAPGHSNNITVAVRVRPFNAREKEHGVLQPLVMPMNTQVVTFDPRDPNCTKTEIGNSRGTAKDASFTYDYVFDATATQEQVFAATTQHLIADTLDGFNATVFAYGATGAGKTHTMMGSDADPGVMVRTMQALFAAIADSSDDHRTSVSLTYLEVYNECIRDLLVDSSRALQLREDAAQGMVVAGLTRHTPSDAAEVFKLLAAGNQRRQQAATGANAESSRSHAVLQVTVRREPRARGTTMAVSTGKLCMIDLAGSERAAVTRNKGVRLAEGANINKSLLALGNCINALCDGKRGAFVPYRNSKLTRLLKDSLGGNCKTVMIAAVSPSRISYEDTYNTLRYANRAKNIKTKVSSNTMTVSAHVTQYQAIIRDLQSELARAKRGGSTSNAVAALAPAASPSAGLQELQQLVQRCKALTQTVAQRNRRRASNSAHSRDLLAELAETQAMVLQAEQAVLATAEAPHVHRLRAELELVQHEQSLLCLASTAAGAVLALRQAVLAQTEAMQAGGIAVPACVDAALHQGNRLLGELNLRATGSPRKRSPARRRSRQPLSPPTPPLPLAVQDDDMDGDMVGDDGAAVTPPPRMAAAAAAAPSPVAMSLQLPATPSPPRLITSTVHALKPRQGRSTPSSAPPLRTPKRQTVAKTPKRQTVAKTPKRQMVAKNPKKQAALEAIAVKAEAAGRRVLAPSSQRVKMADVTNTPRRQARSATAGVKTGSQAVTAAARSIKTVQVSLSGKPAMRARPSMLPAPPAASGVMTRSRARINALSGSRTASTLPRRVAGSLRG